MLMEDAATALHLLRDVLELDDGTVSAIHVGCVRLVIRKPQKNLGRPAPRQPEQRHQTPPHGKPAKATWQQQEKRGLQLTSSFSSAWRPSKASVTDSAPRCREDARCGTRSFASCAYAQARGSRTPGRNPPQGGAHIAHGAAPAPPWPSRRLVSGSSTLGSSGSTLGRVDTWAGASRLPPRRPKHETQRRW